MIFHSSGEKRLRAFGDCLPEIGHGAGGTALDREMSTLDAADAAEIAAMAVNETLLSEGNSIDALRERLGAIRKATDDLPRRRQARDDFLGKLSQRMEDLEQSRNLFRTFLERYRDFHVAGLDGAIRSGIRRCVARTISIATSGSTIRRSETVWST